MVPSGLLLFKWVLRSEWLKINIGSLKGLFYWLKNQLLIIKPFDNH